jgi:hypothetical protein
MAIKKTTWDDVAQKEFAAMDKGEQTDWADLRARIAKRQ